MPLEKPLIRSGDSLVVVVPRAWLKAHERKEGREVVAIDMSVNDAITIRPIFGGSDRSLGARI